MCLVLIQNRVSIQQTILIIHNPNTTQSLATTQSPESTHSPDLILHTLIPKRFGQICYVQFNFGRKSFGQDFQNFGQEFRSNPFLTEVNYGQIGSFDKIFNGEKDH